MGRLLSSFRSASDNIINGIRCLVALVPTLLHNLVYEYWPNYKSEEVFLKCLRMLLECYADPRKFNVRF